MVLPSCKMTAPLNWMAPVTEVRISKAHDAQSDGEVLLDDAAAGTAEAYGEGELVQVVGHEGDVGRFQGGRGAGAAHGDADGGCG